MCNTSMLKGGCNCCKETRNFGTEANKMSEQNTKGTVETGSKLKNKKQGRKCPQSETLFVRSLHYCP
jgi:hypothetical protein